MSGSRVLFIIAGVTLFLLGLYKLLHDLGVGGGHRYSQSYGYSSSYGSSSSHGAGAMIFLSLFLIVIGGGFLAWSLRSRAKAQAGAAAARSWFSVPGVIVQSWVSDELPVAALFTSTRYGQNHHYVPRVLYRYQVGRAFEGSRIRFGYLKFAWPGRAREVLQRYPEGAPVTVRYDPANPAESVLELETSTGGLMVGIVGGAVVLAAGLVFLVLTIAG